MILFPANSTDFTDSTDSTDSTEAGAAGSPALSARSRFLSASPTSTATAQGCGSR
ncbi:hypothetical protein [Streptomyces sp. NPDC004435]|uniref:hypothetical protein n=1 Tax=Streptomyces sp. NPDC004435 TaxID=3364701 RepID=UPI0036AE4C41